MVGAEMAADNINGNAYDESEAKKNGGKDEHRLVFLSALEKGDDKNTFEESSKSDDPAHSLHFLPRAPPFRRDLTVVNSKVHLIHSPARLAGQRDEVRGSTAGG